MARFTTGDQIGEFTVTDVLNEGGWAVVYAAGHRRMGRLVALKVLRSELIEDGSARKRLLREAQVVNDVRHPNIVEVHDLVEQDDPPLAYLVMELLDGEDLATHLDYGSFSPRDAVWIGLQVACALEAIHNRGIVHRDIKPDNIILVDLGADQVPQVKLLDFGLAKGLREIHKTQITPTGESYGTLEYLAPEIATGGEATPRSDIYALGATIYTLLTGQLPFGPAGPGGLEQFVAKLAQPVRPPTEVRSSIPEAVERVVLCCMEKIPEERYVNARAVSDALADCLQQLTPLKDPITRFPLAHAVVARRFMVGDHIGPHLITDQIKVGDRSTVFRVSHTRLGRSAALKIISADRQGDQEALQRFLREARAVNEIGHPNIVEIHDLGEDLGFDPPLSYMVMELLEGRSLRDYLQTKGVLDPLEVVAIGAQVADALDAVHKAKILHRDIKPENIFLVEAPDCAVRVKLIGFGLVKAFGGRLQKELTPRGVAVGTPEYMAPEQIRGGEVDERTDVYGLGVTLYEMLAGAPPFRPTADLGEMVLHQTQSPPPFIAVGRGGRGAPVPLDLDAVVMCCLAKQPEDRFQSVASLKRSLESSLVRAQPEALVDNEGLQVLGPTEWLTTSGEYPRARPGDGRRRWLLVGLGLFLVTFGVVVGVVRLTTHTSPGIEPRRPPPAASKHEPAAPPEPAVDAVSLVPPDAGNVQRPRRATRRAKARRSKPRKGRKKRKDIGSRTINPFR